MIQQPPPELFAERPVSSDFAQRGPSYAVRRLVTVAVLLAVVGGGLYLYFGRSHPVNPGDIPTIKAEGSYKQKPEQPGGIDIPHRDVQVYQELDGSGEGKPQIEHLLPPPETPQAAPASAAQNTATVPVTEAPQVESLIPQAPKIDTTVAPAPKAEPVPAPVAVAPVPMQAPAPAAVETAPLAAKPAPVAPAAPAPAIIRATKDTSATKGGTVIQFASIPDEADAQKSEANLQAKYAPILGAVRLRLVKADLGAKGIYYRIQSQPVSEDQANQICAAVKQMKAGCIIVHP